MSVYRYFGTKDSLVLAVWRDALVVFYEDLSSSYRYTRIGRVQQPGGLAQALGPVQARVRFTAP